MYGTIVTPGDRKTLYSSPRLLDQGVEARFGQTSNQPAVDHRGGRGGAEAQAEDRVEGHPPIGSGSTPFDTQPTLGVCRERIAARRLTGLGAAKLQNMPARQLAAK